MGRIQKILFFRYFPELKSLGSKPSEIDKEIGIYPPVGLAQIAAVCRNAGYRVKIIDAYAEGLSDKKIKQTVQKYSPNIIGVSLLTSTFEGEIEGIRRLKSICEKAIIIAGGPHFDLYTNETLQRVTEIDYAVIGEGEDTILDLLQCLNNGGDLSRVPGIAYRLKEKIMVNEMRKPIKNLDRLPFPLISELPVEKYRSIMTRNGKIMYLLTARGCPFRCRYCTDYQFGRTVRYHSPEYVAEYIRHIVKDIGLNEFDIYDDTFTVNKKRALNICKDIIQKKLPDIKWSIRTRPDRIGDELLSALKRAGCYRIIYGVESGNQEILDLMDRGMTIEQIEEAFRLSKKHRFELSANFMIGYLNESKETYRKTVDFAKKLDPDYAMFSITRVKPNSDLCEDLKERGLYIEDHWKKYISGQIDTVDKNHARINGKDYDVDELDRMLSKAYFSFYMRPKQILRMILKINSFSQFMRYFKMGMAIVKGYLNTKMK